MSVLKQLSHKELINLAHSKCIPPLLSKFHKGQTGRVCIIGGCEDYTGAPYFSANATALMGCDLTHVICERQAAPIIKGYSPNLMVHPYLSSNVKEYPTDFDKIKSLLSRIHVIVIGPGLGRDPSMLESCKRIIQLVLEEHEGKIPIVIDADGLFLLSNDREAQDFIKRFPKGRIILTPNVVEFQRLYTALFNKDTSDDIDKLKKAERISELLQCIVFCKGRTDHIVASNYCNLENVTPGSNKRVGGQGDTLTGTIACMLSYSRAIHDFKLIDPNPKIEFSWLDYALLSCYSGSTITRTCSKLAYQEKGRAMQTTDMNNYVGQVFQMMFPEELIEE
ncbi:hypothetical protein Kpol_543p68 [Vanderwaltozyma polyspora DSM 70294]|uniref:ATP-dependent (S)-NAD(P)H-hydrate dehydratase n=1 Tax=Vanderwaltozyma polyspora (strain ATCC 22028 / DSM 70294 / BCRC 21397 / CBS 2163 / NBRC 10782 / NRRL Y-8283 / UCD 57-17) TaxID=436907 RepID=A7THS2_VANPO|nr:uncharacterized protein Kpol_543p68 [Vanderwaltozyma polyspora DSM 70294]EDO18238.1 hypothetical protein Kpol_543p68 [Vanderwaltozyma polyspora DSM 70294]